LFNPSGIDQAGNKDVERVKRTAVILILIISISPATSGALEPSAGGSCRAWGIGVSAGTVVPVSGSLDMEHSSKDILDPGPALALTLSKRASRRFLTEISIYTGSMEFGREIYSGSSNFSLAALLLGNSFSVVRSGRLDLRIRAGAGLYYWRICAGEYFGGAREFEGEDLEKISIGLQGGLGAELIVTGRFSVTAHSGYNYILSRDTFHFGKGFTEQGIINLNVGLKYRL
jgi:hypothetical protein